MVFVAAALVVLFVLLQGAFAEPGMQFAIYPYGILALVLVFRASPASRFPLAALLGLVADLFSAGRFGAFSLAFALSYFPAQLVSKYLSAEYSFSRFIITFVFVFSVQLFCFLIGDTSASLRMFPAFFPFIIYTALANGLLALALWPLFSWILTSPGKKLRMTWAD
ncbi:MAG: hypothetical protein U5N86_04870 [Planctomycetota bacterium]|nr:hypothetical protein [Planctomycetota bacterium]